MSSWSDLYSKIEASSNKPNLRNDFGKDEYVLPNVSYEEFDKVPGKSVSLLNNDSAWNRFVHFESDNDEELVARFKHKEFENHILNTAYDKGLVDFRTIESSGGYELSISITHIITTFSDWSIRNEPILMIKAMLLRPINQVGRNRCVFEYTYFVHSPFEGHIVTFYMEENDDRGRIYQLYTAKRTRELWPLLEHMGWIYDTLQNNPRVTMHFNEYMYDEKFYDGIPYWDWEADDKYPCVIFEWKVNNFLHVVQDQHVCSIIKNPYTCNRKEYKIYSPVSGIIVIGENGNNKEYTYISGKNIHDLFTVYKDKSSLIRWQYNMGNDPIKNVDDFEGTVSLSWEKVAGRELPPQEFEFIEDGYRGFEMVSDAGKYIVVSLQVKSNIPYIVFSVNSRVIRLSNGDVVELLFENIYGEKSVLTFPITRNYVDESLKDIYDISFFCELSDSHIECMREYYCVSWKVRFGKQPLMSVVGYNESSWCPREYAGEVFKAYVEEYLNQIEKLKEEFPIEFTSPQKNVESSAPDESCYVYLMFDRSTGYFKIGISNNPEYREHTLQSEKPTIDKICAKEYPNRIIAFAIESALHKAYESKRIRGEWFSLEAKDVNAIIATLT